MLFSITSLPPLLIDLWYQEGTGEAFLYSYMTLLSVGLVLWLPVRNEKKDLRLRDGFLVVVLFWFVLGISGALPDRKSTRLNSSHRCISYAVFCLKKQTGR